MDEKILQFVESLSDEDIKTILKHILTKLDELEKEVDKKANRQAIFR